VSRVQLLLQQYYVKILLCQINCKLDFEIFAGVILPKHFHFGAVVTAPYALKKPPYLEAFKKWGE